MGKNMLPAFANIFMHFWKQQALSSTHPTPIFWKRHIDDTFGIWQHSGVQLQNYLQHLNSVNPNIKDTLTCSSLNINFLDCTVFKHNNHLVTKIFRIYRLSDCYTSIPIILAMTLKALSKPKSCALSGCILILNTLASYQTLKSSLLQCGYPRSFNKNCKRWALSITNCNPNIMNTGCKPCLTKHLQTLSIHLHYKLHR